MSEQKKPFESATASKKRKSKEMSEYFKLPQVEARMHLATPLK